MKEENPFDRLAKQIQDDIKGLTELSGKLVELDKEEKRIDKSARWLIVAAVIGVAIAVGVIAWVILT